MAQEVKRDQLEAEVCWVPKVQRVTLEELENLGLLDYKALEDLLEEWVQEEPWVPKENLERMAEMEKLESLEFRVFLVDLVQWVHLEIRVPWEIKELKDLLEFQDHQAQEEILARMEQQVSQGLLDRLDQLEREAWWVLLEPEDSK